MSAKPSWLQLYQRNTPAKDAGVIMGCHTRTAREKLRELEKAERLGSNETTIEAQVAEQLRSRFPQEDRCRIKHLQIPLSERMPELVGMNDSPRYTREIHCTQEDMI